jgi:hypothetical protein
MMGKWTPMIGLLVAALIVAGAGRRRRALDMARLWVSPAPLGTPPKN